MKKDKSSLYSYLSGKPDICLAYDECDSVEEVKATFIEAYSFYVGRKPRQSTIDKFLRNHTITATNGIKYEFSYFD